MLIFKLVRLNYNSASACWNFADLICFQMNYISYQHLLEYKLFRKLIKLIKKTSPWELMDPQTKNDSDKTQDICMPDSMFLVY